MSTATLLKLLEIPSNRFEMGTTSAHNHLTPEDVSFCLARIRDRKGALLLVIKFRGHFQDYPALEEMFRQDVLQEVAREGWAVKSPRTMEGFSRMLARLALFEFLIPLHCETCKGRGTIQHRSANAAPGQRKRCEDCKGGGLGTMSDRERARQLGLAPQTYNNTWRARYQRIQLKVDRVYAGACRQLKAAAKDEAAA